MALDKLVDSTQLNTDLTSVANAIRIKGDTSAQLAFPSGFVSAVQAIPTGITPSGTKQISITQNGTTTEDVTAFANAEITVDVQGGGDIDALISGTIISVSSDVTSIKNYALLNCMALATVSFPNVTSVGEYAFTKTGLTEITETQFPSLVNSGSNSFREMGNITRFFLPKATVGLWAVRKNVLLTAAVFRKLDYQGNFMECSALQKVDISTGGVLSYAFSNTAINLLVLRSTTLQSLSGTNAFDRTPFASGGTGGTIYIPKALYDHLGDGTEYDYKAATNWSTIDAYGTITWSQIEGSIYETQYADGTPIPTT